MKRTACRLLAALAAAALLLQPAPASAQAASADPTGGDARLVQITQIGPAEQPLGDPTQVACPASGCQTILQLAVDSRPEPFLLSVQFVARGAYVTLVPRSIGTAEVLDFDQGRKGAIFLPLRTPGRHVVRMEFVVVRSASVRALEPHVKGQVLASGNVFNRKRRPDLVLRIEFAPPGR
jgi:hypothetical protein